MKIAAYIFNVTGILVWMWLAWAVFAAAIGFGEFKATLNGHTFQIGDLTP